MMRSLVVILLVCLSIFFSVNVGADIDVKCDKGGSLNNSNQNAKSKNMMELYDCFFDSGQYKKSAEILKRFEGEGNLPYLNYYIAESLYLNGDLHEALEYANKEYKYSKNDLGLALLRFSLIEKLNGISEALAILDEQLIYLDSQKLGSLNPANDVRLSPEEVEFFYEASSAVRRLDEPGRANDILIVGLRRNPSSIKLYDESMKYSQNAIIRGMNDQLGLSPFCKNIVIRMSSYCVE